MMFKNSPDLWGFSEEFSDCTTPKETKEQLEKVGRGKCPYFVVEDGTLVGVRLEDGINPTWLALNMPALRSIARGRLLISNPTLTHKQVYNLTMYGYGFTQTFNHETRQVAVYYLPKEKDRAKRCVKKRLLWTAPIGVEEDWIKVPIR